VPLSATLDLLDQALAGLMETHGSDLSYAQIADAADGVGRLVAAVHTLAREAVQAHRFADFLADHPELSS
jgi:hypothetical protein